ncbi:MAG: SusD/RagB family nutrient-binding outer membrane lipoprotein [Flavitalea sp.]
MNCRHTYTTIILTCAALFFFAGCTKNFDSINTDPRLVGSGIASPSLILTKVQKESVFNLMEQDSRLEVYTGYTGHTTTTNALIKGPWDEPFGTFYTSFIVNISEAVRLSADDEKLANINAAARIWKVWLFSRLTDLYGDIPYFSAAKNVNEVDPAPAYDKQQDIYNDFFKELKEAVDVLKADDGSRKAMGNQDLLYKGDIASWIRFGNSLRFRLAMRVRYADPALAALNVQEVINDELITDNSQNALIKAGDANQPSNENKNPYFNGIAGGAKEFRWASFTLAENLTKLNDPRASVFIKPSSVGDYFGIFLCISTDEKAVNIGRPDNSDSELGDIAWRPDFTFRLLTAPEVYFLRAEAALEGITTEDANDQYFAGIDASMDYFNIAGADKTDYLASAAGSLSGTSEEKLEMIITQKWLANFLQFDEAYADFRRTGYPRIYVGHAPSDTNGEVPRRIQYPLSEYNSNNAKVMEAVGRLSGGDNLTSKVWWDANPNVPVHHPKQGIYPPF